MNEETKATFNVRDRERLVQTEVKVDHLQLELNEHKHSDVKSFDKIEQKFDMIRKDIQSNTKILYMLLGGLMLLQVVLKFVSFGS